MVRHGRETGVFILAWGLLWAQAHAQPATQRPARARTGVGQRQAKLQPLTGRERVQQLLSRFTYGPQPGQVDRVLAEGEGAWFGQQLNPSVIPDAALNRRLADDPTIAMTPQQALAVFPDRHQVEAFARGNMPMPSDPLQRAVMEVEVRKLDEGKEKKEQKAAARSDAAHPASSQEAEAKPLHPADEGQLATQAAAQLFALPKEQRMAALVAMPVDERVAVTRPGNLPPRQHEALLREATPREREAWQAMAAGPNSSALLGRELEQAHALRDILSERQVETVMTDLWFNHFNVLLEKGPDRWYTASYERDAIRPHALGKFRDLLLATATSPAMMVYLDNFQSVGPDSEANGAHPGRPQGKRGARGLNENYGREVMELHTVGVNGGYTQADVTSLAAILTGWGVEQPQDGGPFTFSPRRHEPGAKAWFGHCISDTGQVTPLTAGGAVACEQGNATDAAAPDSRSMQQGIAALRLLADSPQTAHAVAFLLAQYFVADTPPPALVERLATTYLASDGDIKAMLREIVNSPEFNSRQYFRNKVKTPMEFLASSYRTTGTDPQNPEAIVRQARTMGMPLYGALPPTGYHLTAEFWMNSTALVDRLNFAYQLSGGRIPNQSFDGSRLLTTGLLSLDRLPRVEAAPPATRSTGESLDGAERLLPTAASADFTTKPQIAVTAGTDFATRVLAEVVTGGPVSAKTNRLIEQQASGSGSGTTAPALGSSDRVNLITGLLLGSPEFQMR